MQLVRYGIVGIFTNILVYAGYLLTTHHGLGHKTAMTVFYVAGIMIGFFLNRSWTFCDSGNIPTTFLRYATVYGLGYLVNYAGLYLLVDVLGFVHQFVQGMMILIVAGMLYVLQRHLVFTTRASGARLGPGQGTT